MKPLHSQFTHGTATAGLYERAVACSRKAMQTGLDIMIVLHPAGCEKICRNSRCAMAAMGPAVPRSRVSS
ncbi:hypothetical protein LP417_11410 [Polaromonas sp. P1-6]|nr:hypothetical protein LP417_11410 [Polaromonas sp. P1-6]UUZ66791.1 hypothetical protein LP416_16865 [Polaromonas sp. P2-4]